MFQGAELLFQVSEFQGAGLRFQVSEFQVSGTFQGTGLQGFKLIDDEDDFLNVNQTLMGR